MRVLMTGVTTRHAGGKARVQFANATDALRTCLVEAGVEVEQRPIIWGEDLSMFDSILLGWTQPTSIAAKSQRLINLGWLSQPSNAEKIVLFYDDWGGIRGLHGGSEDVLRHWDRWSGWYEKKWPMTLDQRFYLKRLIEMFANNFTFRGSFIPASGWASVHSLTNAFQATRNSVLYDPTRFSDILDPVSANDSISRERKWVLAALQQHDPWLAKRALKWPVEKFGRPDEKIGGVATGAKTGQELIPEREVKEAYARSWGVLAPKYPTAGWWRARFYHSAVAGSILLPDESESMLMGPAFQFKGWQIESKSDDALAELAAKQAEWTLARVASKEETTKKVLSALGVTKETAA